jgi:hypothetical protein
MSAHEPQLYANERGAEWIPGTSNYTVAFLGCSCGWNSDGKAGARQKWSEHMEPERHHPSQSDAKLVERPYTIALSEHDLRHIRVILKRWAIEQKDWAQVRCAVGIYERINEQLSDETKDILAGPPKPARDRNKERHEHTKA